MQNQLGKVRGVRQSVDGSRRGRIASHRVLPVAAVTPGKADEQPSHTRRRVLHILWILGKLYDETHSVRYNSCNTVITFTTS